MLLYYCYYFIIFFKENRKRTECAVAAQSRYQLPVMQEQAGSTGTSSCYRLTFVSLPYFYP